MREYSDMYNCFTPQELVMIHGDFHFQNILISDDYSDFVIADPRGELAGSDIFYDFGKLWHSFDGKYDLIHTKQEYATNRQVMEMLNLRLILGQFT